MGEDLLPIAQDGLSKTESAMGESNGTLPVASDPAVRSALEVHADLRAGVQAHILRKAARQSKKVAPIDEHIASSADTEATDVNHEPKDAEIGEDEDEGEEEEESEDEMPAPSRVRKIGENRRKQNAIFESYIHEQAKKAPLKLPSEDDEDQPIKYLVRQTEAQQIISSPREYQIELFERAKDENIIAVLDTGSGKTLIAVLLLEHILNKELEDRASGKPKRISFFVVDSVALVFQQFSVLDCNLNQPMERFCGDMDFDLSSKSFWLKKFSENMVIVCTAAVLENCLLRNYISMDGINLLIFDEAHHAKKNHAYARIIKDFYTQVEDKSRLPRIFGMTASPVDARVEVQKAALELEGLLHCRIATASDLSLIQHAATSKLDQILNYDPLGLEFETNLNGQLIPHIKSLPVFAKPLRWAREASKELGPWCSDQVWQHAFSEDELHKLRAKTQRKLRESHIADFDKVLETSLGKIKDASAIVKNHKFVEPLASADYLSSKVHMLVQYLREHYELPSQNRCIVFVKQRYTAMLLGDLLARETIGTPHLRVGTLVGTRKGDAGDANFSFRQQIVTLMRFRKGQVNCLIATSVAEEGIDIPDCNLVVRFDLYDTLIQYIQSRGRARQQNSRYVHMIEKGNPGHTAIVREVKKNEGILRQFCDALPADRFVTGNDYDMDYFLSKERKQRFYIEPKSKAKLTYRSSLVVLSSFVSSLPQSEESSSQPEYMVTMRSKEFVGEVRLPDTSPVAGAVGRPYSTKQVAKCSAAFEACLLLRKGKYLDEHFNSTFKKQLPTMRNAVLAVSEKRKEEYTMRTKPAIWSVDSVPKQLYLTVMTLENPEVLDRPSQPLGLLTRTPLPNLPPCPLYFSGKRSSQGFWTSVAEPFNVDEASLEKINKVTLRTFDHVFSKEFEADIAHTPYFFVPIKAAASIDAGTKPLDVIDWEAVETISKSNWLDRNDNKAPHWNWNDDLPDDFLVDRFIIDPHDGSRKLISTRVASEYKPLDPIPPNTAPIKKRRQGLKHDNIMEYSVSLWAKARARVTFNEDQRVIEAQFLSLRRNLLDSDQVDEVAPTKCYVILEPLPISSIPTTFVVMAYNFPAMIHRLEAHLVTLEACNILHLPDIDPLLALEAMTKDSDNSEEHSQLQIHFQRGMGKNYERLEFLGDAFLKMATTISLYTHHPENDEYQYHVQRMVLICNLNMLNNALSLGLQEYVRSQSFNRKAWYPENLKLIRGASTKAATKHNLGDKSIADVCEALIGAALLTEHESGSMDLAVRAVTAIVLSADHVQTKFADYYQLYKKPTYQTQSATAAQEDLAKQVEEADNYHFTYPRLVRSAFTHSSYPFSYEHVPNYQRLEFLGDALLDMACINYLFHKFPTRDPQWLTEHKMAMVSNQFLGALCVSLGFHKHMLSFSAIVKKQIQNYVEEIQECREQAEREAILAGKRAEDCIPDYWVHARDPPKCLPDVVEAYVGALFVDSEYDYQQVVRFFEDHVLWFFKDMAIYDTFANKHPTTFLTNFLTLSMGCNQWRLYASELPTIPGDGILPRIVSGVMIHNEIIVDATAKSARYAKVAASKKALEMLNGLGRPEFRSTYHCDCKVVDLEEEERNSANGEEFVPATAV